MNYFFLLFLMISDVCKASFLELSPEELNTPTKTIGDIFLMNPASSLSYLEGPERGAAVHEYLQRKIAAGFERRSMDAHSTELNQEETGKIFMEAGEACHWLGHIYSELKYKLFESDQLIWYETTLKLHQTSLSFYQLAASYGVIRAESLNGANPVPILHAQEHIAEAQDALAKVSN